MSLGTDGVPFTMPVEPAGTSNNSNNGWGGDWSAWIVIFILFACFGGFGGGWGGFGGGFGNGAYPTESILQRSLDTQTIIGKLDGVSRGICDSTYSLNNSINGLGTTVMQGFNGIGNAICNSEYQNAQLINGVNTNMMQGFNATQVAMMQGNNALQAQLAQCCCDNRVGQMQIQNQMAADTCAVTNMIQNTTRDSIDNQNRNHQALMDKLCQMEYNGLNDKYQAAMAENQALKFQISQSGQNNVIGARIDAATAEILRRTGNDCPVNAVVVQPNTPVQFPTNCCGQFAGWNNGCNQGCVC